MANSLDPDKTYRSSLFGAVCSGSTLFAYILNLSVNLGIFLQQTTSADERISSDKASNLPKRDVRFILLK